MGVPTATVPPTDFEQAMTKLKKHVFKTRTRVKEFFLDFDKLRSGFVYPNHFLTSLGLAGLDKALTAAELQTIADAYTVPRSPSLIQTDWKTFVTDVDVVFTLPVRDAGPLGLLDFPWALRRW
jgi:hypothetical protein